MRRPLIAAFAVATLLASAAGTAATAAPSDTTAGDKKVCSTPQVGYAACDAHVRTKGARPDATTTRNPSSYISTDLRSAYKLTTDSTATVAIVDAYASPNAVSDLTAYRAATGLPALTTGQFTQFNQTGGTALPSGNASWGQEEMLDLEMVSAICPSCQIVYVGGNSASFNDLAAAVNTAAGKATVISNSYGGSEFSGETSLAAAYNHPGIAITVSSGDSGYGVQVPAAFNTVTAVGGTTLQHANNARGWTETAWSGAGSGCSTYIAKQSWQKDAQCSRRTVADVSAIADPATGVAVFDSYGSSGGANWYVFGGTSVAAPIIGAVYALSGNTSGIPASIAYANPKALFDVVSGSNTRKCRLGYLCTAVTGYDGPTGLGTPNGTAAF
ncbi:MAG: protease-like protein [Frankiales bacterium]|nr:protease-like protein [Frankiales bacterium]